MSVMRRVRAEGRKAAIAASALALAGLATGGYFISEALAAPNPPAPAITGSPANPTTTSSATFTFTDSQAGVTFKCSKDGALFTTCASGINYSGLPQGNHTFRVEALSGSNTSNVTSFSWAIIPPTPTIVTHPATLTGATTASFTYSDTQSGVTFKCALDGSNFNPCSSSGTNYNSLGGGSHTFRVEVQVGSNPPSLPATFGWTIDLTAPTITLTFPTNGSAYNATGWTNGCTPSTAGICGSAADPSGVASVGVALRQQSSGKYWNGSTFSSNTIVFNTAVLGTPNGTSTTWKYAKTLPADGQYTVSVRATDGFGNTTANNNLTTATFTIDTIAPPAPALTTKPSNPSKVKNPEFEFTNTDTQATFTCKLDSGTPTPCAGDSDHDGDGDSGDGGARNSGPTFGEMQYNNLTAGNHCFSVYATDTAGNSGPTTTYCWTISGTVTQTAINVSSGSPQIANPNTAFAPLVAIVTGTGNVPVPGVQVTFNAPGSGASGTFGAPCSGATCVVTADVNGLATAPTFTANATSGAYTVTATATGVATPANFSLTNSIGFAMAGSLSTPFAPGLSQPVNVTFTNPNPANFTIPASPAAGSVNITVTTNKPLCDGPTNFKMTQGLLVPVTVLAHTTTPVSLSSLLVPQADWPVVKMLDLTTPQDNCKHATLTLHYTGVGAP